MGALEVVDIGLMPADPARFPVELATGLGVADLLPAREATRETILGRLDALIREARAGDVLVFQFSGHGTQVPDACWWWAGRPASWAP